MKVEAALRWIDRALECDDDEEVQGAARPHDGRCKRKEECSAVREGPRWPISTFSPGVSSAAS